MNDVDDIDELFYQDFLIGSLTWEKNIPNLFSFIRVFHIQFVCF